MARNPEDFMPDNQMPRQGMGSGVIIDSSGIVLTNNHVVEGADEVIVHLADGREFKAEDIKTDEQTDLAVLRIKGAGTLPAATMGDSSSEDRRLGDGDRQSVRAGTNRQCRHHQRHGPRIGIGSPSPILADRCGD